MRRVRGKDTSLELLVRRRLFAKGFRYRLHPTALPGRPDIVLPRFHTAILVHGCFWHAHGCKRSKLPATNREFWQQKIAANAERDRGVTERLRVLGWRVRVLCQCSIEADLQQVIDDLEELRRNRER